MSSNKSTNQLIDRCIARDPQSQRALFKQYNGYVFSISYRYMKIRQDAEEVLQDSWIEIFKNLGSFSQQASFEGWIKTITIRTAWKAIRSKSKDVDLETITHPSTEALDQRIMDKMTCEEVLQLLEVIPTGSKEVFKMAIIDGLSHEEIGALLGINASTSRAHLSRARKLLKEKFNSINKISHGRIQSI